MTPARIVLDRDGAIAPHPLESIAHLTIGDQLESVARDRRACHVARSSNVCGSSAAANVIRRLGPQQNDEHRPTAKSWPHAYDGGATPTASRSSRSWRRRAQSRGGSGRSASSRVARRDPLARDSRRNFWPTSRRPTISAFPSRCTRIVSPRSRRVGERGACRARVYGVRLPVTQAGGSSSSATRPRRRYGVLPILGSTNEPVNSARVRALLGGTRGGAGLRQGRSRVHAMLLRSLDGGRGSISRVASDEAPLEQPMQQDEAC